VEEGGGQGGREGGGTVRVVRGMGGEQASERARGMGGEGGREGGRLFPLPIRMHTYISHVQPCV
jgi:hypothetical protein